MFNTLANTVGFAFKIYPCSNCFSVPSPPTHRISARASCYLPCFCPGTLSPQGPITSTSSQSSTRTLSASSYPPPAQSSSGLTSRPSPLPQPQNSRAHGCSSNTLHLPSPCLEHPLACTCEHTLTPCPAPNGSSTSAIHPAPRLSFLPLPPSPCHHLRITYTSLICLLLLLPGMHLLEGGDSCLFGASVGIPMGSGGSNPT